MKLSKQQIKQHEKALSILEKPELTEEERLYVYENWLPAYNNQIGKIASFFTPLELAKGFAYFAGGGRVVDLCAGIGILSYMAHRHTFGNIELVCIERNREFVEVGKKLLPEAQWICGDVLDESLIKSLGRFQTAISNPPYGNIKTSDNGKWLKYSGSEFEYKVIEVGGHIADYGAFILPQQSVPFLYSGRNSYVDTEPAKHKKFNQDTGIELEMNAGYDTSRHKDEWIGTSIITEIALCDYLEVRSLKEYSTVENICSVQLSLFD